MRIRKRPVPFPLSSLSPVPISDPLLDLNLNLNRPPPQPVVQLRHCYYDPSSQNDAVNPPGNSSPGASQPSDRPTNHRFSPIGRGTTTDGCDFPDARKAADDHKEEDLSDNLFQDEEDEIGEEGEKGNDIRKRSISGAEAFSGVLLPEPQVGMRWCEGEKAFPLKKRRGSYERVERSDGGEYSTIVEDHDHDHHQKAKKINTTKTQMARAKPSSLTNKKSFHNSRRNDVVVVDVEDDDSQFDYNIETKKETHHQQLGNNINGGGTGTTNKSSSNSNSNSNNNKKTRGGALMEGSRCSRVNGRGWRCCQQTLVGYSLCEHHLGKGRLRSMTSVRSRSLASKTTTKKTKTTTTITDNPRVGPLSSSGAYCSMAAGLKEEDQEKETKCVNKKVDSNIVHGGNHEDDDDEEEEDDDNDHEEMKKPFMTSTMPKKRMKLGMVKARSISSLLGQTNNSSTSNTTGAISMADSK